MAAAIGTRVWIAWAHHRRSQVLAQQFEARLYEFESSAPRVLRYAILVGKTFGLLIRSRPEILFCQNPSIILAAVACLLKSPLGFRCVIDRHSNFKFESRDSPSLKWRLFHAISDYSLRAADLTIVTNGELAEFVALQGGRPFVLHDKLPDLAHASGAAALDEPAPQKVVYICSFSWDEPVEEVILAASHLPPSVEIAITGRVPSGSRQRLEALAAQNTGASVRLTGFLDQVSYDRLVCEADAVVVLTTNENTLVCGAYEALAAAKPLVLSDTRALRDFFGTAAVIVKNDSQGIAEGIRTALECRGEMTECARMRAQELEDLWKERFRLISLALSG